MVSSHGRSLGISARRRSTAQVAAVLACGRLPIVTSSPPTTPASRPAALLAIATFKLLKALLLIALGICSLSLVRGADSLETLNGLVRQLHFDPGNHRIHRVIALVASLDARRLEELSLGTFVYAAIFLVEGVGLLLRKRWAEHLTTWVTASFVPLELYELFHRPSALKAAGVIANLLIVAYLVGRLRRTRSSPKKD